ncbi:hypothetical protein SAMN02745857_01796 [Andreprevotia lacus DSM 23236]|jgi:hypothetical protein|uniref:Uncharacterized protein n=1 Tax=Andreprevotia lacus DSM 23236 TaxID=1121001 RepID=A0A1W1XKA5_9NEIS|nr:hypothetical protein [Andreprevotia lacus]SMC24262.1 hypothetical protein SAMN02745857_01796 [Andreprevotia lacus DSM 23236]
MSGNINPRTKFPLTPAAFLALVAIYPALVYALYLLTKNIHIEHEFFFPNYILPFALLGAILLLGSDVRKFCPRIFLYILPILFIALSEYSTEYILEVIKAIKKDFASGANSTLTIDPGTKPALQYIKALALFLIALPCGHILAELISKDAKDRPLYFAVSLPCGIFLTLIVTLFLSPLHSPPSRLCEYFIYTAPIAAYILASIILLYFAATFERPGYSLNIIAIFSIVLVAAYIITPEFTTEPQNRPTYQLIANILAEVFSATSIFLLVNFKAKSETTAEH